MLRLDVQVPDDWQGRNRISIQEYRDLVSGKVKRKAASGPKLRGNPLKDFATYQDGKLTIVIHELPPSQNQWKKWHWSVVADEKKRWEEILWGLCLEVGKPHFKIPSIQVTFCFPDNRRRDPADNYMSWKAINDGLTLAGVITDDSWQELRVREPVVIIDRRNPRTEITVSEI